MHLLVALLCARPGPPEPRVLLATGEAPMGCLRRGAAGLKLEHRLNIDVHAKVVI